MFGDASPFELVPAPGACDPAPHGVLCIHGFTGTPFEMRYLGEQLAARGLVALGPALPGHASTPDELDRTGWRDWVRCVEDAFDRLRERCARVAVVGQSLGGLLALRLAATRGSEVSAVASLAAPLWLPWPVRVAVRVTRPGSILGRVRRLPKPGGGSDVLDPAMKRDNPSYRVVPLRALHQFVELMEQVRADLGQVRAPLLVVHSPRDHTAPYASAGELLARVRSPVRAHRRLERSYHLVAMDVERDQVAAEVGDFFAARFRDARAPAHSPRKETP